MSAIGIGHRLVHRTCPLLTQSGHQSDKRPLVTRSVYPARESRINSRIALRGN
jgi:hypothetical protein